VTNTGCLLTTSDNEIGKIDPVPSGCGANRAIFRCRPRLWNHQSRSASAPYPFDEDLSMGTRSRPAQCSLASFLHKGIDGLLDEQRPGTSRKLSDEDAERVLTYTPVVLTGAEIKVLVETMPLRESTLVLVAASTGLRQSELFGLKWRDIDCAKGELNVVRSIVCGVEGHCKRSLRSSLFRCTRSLPRH
jgi:integrase